MNKWIKIALISGLHLLSGFFLGVVCEEIQGVFPKLFTPTPNLLQLLIKMCACFGTAIITSTLVALVLQPLFAYVVVFLLHGIGILIGWGEFSLISIVFLIVYLLLGIGFVFSAQQRMRDRIHVSLQPMSESKSMILISMVLLICGALYLGSKAYIDKYGFHLPEKLMMAFMEPFKEQAMAGQPEEEREQAEAQFEEEFSKAIKQMEREALKPIEPYIPILIPVMLFFSLETIISLLSFIPMLLLEGIFRLLKTSHFIKIEKTTSEVEKISL